MKTKEELLNIKTYYDVMTSALEGGSDYWCEFESSNYNTKNSDGYHHLNWILDPYGQMTFNNKEEDSLRTITTKYFTERIKQIYEDKSAYYILKGSYGQNIELNGENFLNHLIEEHDSPMADWFWQKIVFNEILYG